MTAVRRIALLSAALGWIYSWSVVRGVRTEYSITSTPLPVWLVFLLGSISTLLIAAGIVAGMKAPFWPVMAVLAACAFALLLVIAQQAVMQNALDFAARSGGGEARSVPLSFAARAALRSRGPLAVVVVTVLPLAMLLSGLTGLFAARFEVPHG